MRLHQAVHFVVINIAPPINKTLTNNIIGGIVEVLGFEG
jgi:hypothetical protein